MNRSRFIQSLTASTALLAGANLSGFARTPHLDAKPSPPTPILPPHLNKGDTIGIVCPSSAVEDNFSFTLAQETFEALGFKVKFGQYVHRRFGHLAGFDKEKLSDIHQMFADREVKAIICMRGGSGAARLLDQLDYELIRKNPKILMGYSDITALHAAIQSQTGLITFHGPVGTSTWPAFNVDQFQKVFFDTKQVLYQNLTDKGDDLVQRENRIQTIQPGKVTGKLLGGNLTVLTGISGTPYFPMMENSILFVEDVGEEPYRIERMFSQLKLNGTLHKIKGFIFGQCTDCTPKGGYGSLTIDEILNDYIKPLHIPAFQGAMIGHIKRQFILPIGATVEMDADQGTIKVVQNLFSAS